VKIESARSFRGRFIVPGDKSISHRVAILGAMAEGETRIQNFSSAADCASTLSCLAALGIEIRRDGGSVVISGRGVSAWRAPQAPLDAGNSGSTLRMLAGVLAGRPFRSTLTGDASLCRRPVERVAAPLREMGARLTGTDGKPPLTIEGAALHGISYTLPVASAQVKTAVLLAGVQAQGRTSVTEPGASRDHTERLLPLFGVPLRRDGLTASIEGPCALRGTAITVPGGADSAAFLVVAGLILPDSEVRIDGVLLNPARTAFIEVLRAMGGDVRTGIDGTEPEPIGWIEARSSSLRGTDVPPELVPGLIDEVPALSAAAAFASGTFRVSGAAELRVKESDRIAALVEGLSRLGVDVSERPDGLEIRGGRALKGAAVRAHDDHRIAMALAIAALGASGATEIEGAECASVSFPEFYDFLKQGASR
jgi:3-phosphoshikimate 1-carboxyvinyltransferase